MMQMLRNLIKRAAVAIINDSGNYQTAQVSYFGKVSDIEVINPYGISSSPPIDSLVLMFNVMGQEENKAGIINAQPLRFKNLKEGELVVGNYLTGSYVKFLQNGDIDVFTGNDVNIECGNANILAVGDVDVECSSASVVATTIKLTGNVVITGNCSVSGNLTNNSINVGLLHTHPVSTAPGTTGAVNP